MVVIALSLTIISPLINPLESPTMKQFIITTKPSIYERLADYVLAFGLGVAIAFGLFVYFS
jgi:hypothetical protein